MFFRLTYGIGGTGRHYRTVMIDYISSTGHYYYDDDVLSDRHTGMLLLMPFPVMLFEYRGYWRYQPLIGTKWRWWYNHIATVMTCPVPVVLIPLCDDRYHYWWLLISIGHLLMCIELEIEGGLLLLLTLLPLGVVDTYRVWWWPDDCDVCCCCDDGLLTPWYAVHLFILKVWWHLADACDAIVS